VDFDGGGGTLRHKLERQKGARKSVSCGIVSAYAQIHDAIWTTGGEPGVAQSLESRCGVSAFGGSRADTLQPDGGNAARIAGTERDGNFVIRRDCACRN